MKNEIDFHAPFLTDRNGAQAPCRSKVTEENGIYSITLSPNCRGSLKEAVLYSGIHNFPPDARFYGEGYQMLSQYSGTVTHFGTITGYTDKDHYKLPQTRGFKTVYNYILIGSGNQTLLIGAASCNRFTTEIRMNKTQIQIVQNLEGLEFAPEENIRLEDMVILSGEKNEILKKYAVAISENHPPKKFFEMPAGWCSWYCIGPNISEKDIFDNLKIIKEKTPELKYIQIDDGFQPFMGDWLETSNKFEHPMKEVCRNIRSAGFEPAIWLAPFIASPKSKLFREHPDYFIKDENGAPLSSGEVSFGGWRDGPWYMLDGTNPKAQQYIYDVVYEIYHNWGVRYFKLDAIVWGALPFGIRYDKNATAVEAYRQGMEALWKATGDNAFILGCNAPMWPSLGLVTAMRVTNDVVRNAKHMANLSEQCFNRNWMHKTLWINDPDCLIMSDAVSPVMDPAGIIHKSHIGKKFYKLNNIYIRASGGMILSGDYICKYGKTETDRLKRILDTDYTAAQFDDDLETGTKKTKAGTEYFIFNRSKILKKYSISVPQGSTATDMYSGKAIAVQKNKINVRLRKNDCIWILVKKSRE